MPPRPARIDLATGLADVAAQLVALLGRHLPPLLAVLATLFAPCLALFRRHVARRQVVAELACLALRRRRNGRILAARRQDGAAQQEWQEGADERMHPCIVGILPRRFEPRV